MEQTVGLDISITGIVQGVGFRPHVYNLARSLGLRGIVRNSGRGVLIEVEGPAAGIAQFTKMLRENPPTLARINRFQVSSRPVRSFETFSIAGTGGAATGESVVPPDTATCSHCRREIQKPADRHYQYPFTNCTACGPRFTIVESLPYDRPGTSMAVFAMCPECAREYRDPADRRFHAQPVACPDCGPRVWVTDCSGKVINGDWMEMAGGLLAEGKIIAVKSLGGFHLACDAQNSGSVLALRRGKNRPAKPLAVMCRDMTVVRRHCSVSPVKEALLCAPAAPVVVLEKTVSSTLPDELAPGLGALGVMLPYTPLHMLLMAEGPPVLVMTSGNRSGLPLAIDNHQALAELGDIADYFLLHDREIINRCDDSVLRVVMGEPQFLRRSRGYVPVPVPVPQFSEPDQETVCLGAGGDMKNTFCLLKSGLAYMGQHNASLATRQGLESYRQGLEKFSRLLRMEPAVAGYDPHPGYQSSRLAQLLAPARVQAWHHHAHMASCMAENGLDEKVIGIILDGTGYGRDGSIWGFEVLLGDYRDFTREFHLEYVPLPGGDWAVCNPWITAVAWLVAQLGERGLSLAEDFFPGREAEIKLLGKMVRQGINVPPASSCGRIFDAVAALTGVCLVNTYDGQAAIELGELAPSSFRELGQTYLFTFDGAVIHTGALLVDLISDLMSGTGRPETVKKFHDTVIAAIVDAAGRVRSASGINKVVLSGGSWHNRYLLEGAINILQGQKFTVFYHRQVPPGDGGIALGQAMIALASGEASGDGSCLAR